MPSEHLPRAVLLDLDKDIHYVERFLDGMDYEQFRNDPCTVYAVVRGLEVISDASRRLPDDVKERHPQIPWKKISGAGNVYRHDYEEVKDSAVWQAAQRELPLLLQVVEVELLRFPEETT
jgi:uncharacterized protein with HEPN domain